MYGTATMVYETRSSPLTYFSKERAIIDVEGFGGIFCGNEALVLVEFGRNFNVGGMLSWMFLCMKKYELVLKNNLIGRRNEFGIVISVVENHTIDRHDDFFINFLNSSHFTPLWGSLNFMTYKVNFHKMSGKRNVEFLI